MATRSTISVVHNDGTVTSAYCHWDGYISHNGAILFKSYDTLELAEELVDSGNMSSLAESVDQCNFYKEAPNTYESVSAYKRSGIWEEFNYLFINGRWRVKTSRGDFVELLEEMLTVK